jgi:hypothetical protein
VFPNKNEEATDRRIAHEDKEQLADFESSKRSFVELRDWGTV